MKKKKRKNKKTKVDTSDYYTEVFSKGKKITNEEESTLSDKFQELPWWIPPSGFAAILLILHFTTELGVGYWFFFLIYVFIVFLLFILMLLGKVSNF